MNVWDVLFVLSSMNDLNEDGLTSVVVQQYEISLWTSWRSIVINRYTRIYIRGYARRVFKDHPETKPDGMACLRDLSDAWWYRNRLLTLHWWSSCCVDSNWKQSINEFEYAISMSSIFSKKQSRKRFICELFEHLKGSWEIKQVLGAERTVKFWRGR